MHYRATIPEMAARQVVVDLLASGQVARRSPETLISGRSGRSPRPGAVPLPTRKSGSTSCESVAQGRSQP